MPAIAAVALPRPLALSESRLLRFAVLFLLYVAQGLPLGLFQLAVPSWLAQNGASAGAIGAVLSMAVLPWTLKLFYCFVVDRYSFLAMGRRRPWIIASQMGIILGLLAMGMANPAASATSLIAAFAFTINLASSMQDVAVDGLAVDVLRSEEIARANGFCFGGQAIGMALGAGIGGHLIANAGLPIALATLAAIVAIILASITLIRERPGERLLPWTQGAAIQRNLDLRLCAFGPIIRNVLGAMCQRETLIFLPALFLLGAISGVFTGMAPIFSVQVLGWEKDMYSDWASQSNIVAGILGIAVFGFMAERWGARRMLIVATIGFTVMALTMLALKANWANGLILILAIFTYKSLTTLRGVTAGAVSMTLCSPAVAASQFTLFMAVINLGAATASASLGWLDSIGGIPAMLTAIAVCSLCAAFITLIAKVGR